LQEVRRFLEDPVAWSCGHGGKGQEESEPKGK
jgi:hypothetical protein